MDRRDPIRTTRRTPWQAAGWLAVGLFVIAPSNAVAQKDRAEVIALEGDVILGSVWGGLSDGGTPRLMDPSIGDVNGDGIDDLIVGAPGADPNDRGSAGSVYITFGRSDLLSGDRDLRDLDSWDVRIDGALVGARLGFRTHVGDMNGDDVDDVVMAAPGVRGAVYVKYGTETWTRGVHLISEDEAFDVGFVGPYEGALVGATLCAADIDRDNRIDLVFSALGYDEAGIVDSTDLHVVPGRRDYKRRIYTVDDRVPGRALLSRRVAAGTRAVHTCAIGDLDADGALDVAAGMPLDSVDSHPEAGTVTVVYDVLTYAGGGIDLGDPDVPYGFRINGDQTGARLGASVAIGDFNADTRDDLALASPRRLAVGPDPEGAVFILWGGLLPDDNVVLAPDITLRGPGGEFGSSLRVLDINGDTRDDLVVGAPRADTYGGADSGLVDIYLGGAHINDPTGNVGYDVRVVGTNPGSRFGYGSAHGDIDGDGKPEWVVRQSANPANRPASGSLLALHVPPGAKDAIAGDAKVGRFLGPGRGGMLSPDTWQVDLDGDGSDEFLWLSPSGDGLRGLVCVVQSVPTELSLDLEGACPRRIVGPEGARITSLAAADIDGDGRKEVLLGLDHARTGGTAEVGAVLAVRLSDQAGPVQVDVPELGALPDGGPLAAAWLGGDGAEGLGAWLDVADLDADGAEDVLMAADRATYDDRERAGLLLVIRGGAPTVGRAWAVYAREDTGVHVRLEAPAGAGLGPGSRFMDLDADGKIDIAVSSPLASISGEAQRGAVHVVYDVEGLGTGSWSVADPDVVSTTIVGKSIGALLSVESVEDVDADGVDDLVLVAPWEEVTPQQYGAAYVFYGTPGKRKSGDVVLGDDYSADLRVLAPRGARLTDLAMARLSAESTPRILVTAYPYVRQMLRPQLAVVSARDARPMGVVDLAHEKEIGVRFESQERGSLLELPRTLLDIDEDGDPELWVVLPTANGRATDQGRAMRLAWPAASTDVAEGSEAEP